VRHRFLLLRVPLQLAELQAAARWELPLDRLPFDRLRLEPLRLELLRLDPSS
jgi:hypothetical protein